jgi:uncharacterized protein (TIGR00251 family)
MTRKDPTGAPSIVVLVKVKPRASKSAVLGFREGVLEVAIAAAPVDGAANAELVRTLAAHFDVPKRAVVIESGEASRTKRVRIEGISSIA